MRGGREHRRVSSLSQYKDYSISRGHWGLRPGVGGVVELESEAVRSVSSLAAGLHGFGG